MKKIKIYLANGLFNAADRMYNEVLYKELLKLSNVEVYAPQFNLAINDKKKSAGSAPIYAGDTAKLEWCNVLLAIIDDEDLGTATEIGWIAGQNELLPKNKQRKIICIYTDNRDYSKTYSSSKHKDMISGIAENQYAYINLYTIGACKKYGVVVDSIEKAIKEVKKIK